jgi:ABC-2 type transport system permease protein
LGLGCGAARGWAFVVGTRGAEDHDSRRLIAVFGRIGRSLQRHLALLGGYFTQYLKVRVSHRGDFFIGVATSMAATIFALGFVWVLFRNVPRLADWRFEEVLFLYGFSLIPFGVFNVLSQNIYEFGGEYIMEGKFDRVLIRPVSSLFQVLFEAFRIEKFQEIVVGLVLVFWTARRLGHPWSALDILLLAGFAISGATIYLAVFLALSCFSFWFEDRIGIHPPAWNLLAFGRYPLSIYSSAIRFFLSWIIPFGFATFYPTVRLLHRSEFRGFAALAPVVAMAFSALTLGLWSIGVRHYSSTGS